MGRIIPYIYIMENKKCSKPSTSYRMSMASLMTWYDITWCYMILHYFWSSSRNTWEARLTTSTTDCHLHTTITVDQPSKCNICRCGSGFWLWLIAMSGSVMLHQSYLYVVVWPNVSCVLCIYICVYPACIQYQIFWNMFGPSPKSWNAGTECWARRNIQYNNNNKYYILVGGFNHLEKY